MDKRIIAIIAPLFILLGLGGTYVYYQTKIASRLPSAKEILKVPSKSLNEYTDGSGFSFSYPDNVMVQKKEAAASVYADLQLVSSNIPGSITFKVADPKLATSSAWVRKNDKLESSKKEITVAGIAGYELKAEKGLLTGFIDQGILFTIEVDFQNEKDFWQDIYGTFVETFAFTQAEKESDGSGLGLEGDVTFEDEEIVE